jgi:hypothetical protein
MLGPEAARGSPPAAARLVNAAIRRKIPSIAIAIETSIGRRRLVS